jgi:hypothetical protein
METRDPTTSTRSRRLVAVLFGAFFVALAVLIVVTSEASTRVPAIAVAVVVGGLGLDLIISTIRRKRSLLSRIGPLP